MFQSIRLGILSIALLAALALFGNAWAQESESAETQADAAVVEEPESDADEEEVIVDDGSYVDAEEEDFRPSEEISSDQSITFPTDI